MHQHTWLGEIQAHERRDTGSLDLKDVVIRGDCEVITRQGEAHVGEGITFRALDGVLPVVRSLGTELLVPTSESKHSFPTFVGCLTYKSSARVEGNAIKEVPVSRMTPVLSSSAVASPNVIASRSTSQ